MRLLPLVAPLLLSALPAVADTPPATCETQRNMDEMIDCLLYHQGLAERDLGEALTILRSRYPQASNELDSAQADWSQYRESHCYFVAYPYGALSGSEARLDNVSCKTEMTRRRTAELSDLIDR